MYEKIVKQTRKKIAKITLLQQREILKIYESSIESLTKRIADNKNKELDRRWAIEYRKQLIKERNKLSTELNKSIKGYTTKAAKISTEAEQLVMSDIFKRAKVDIDRNFEGMFLQVQDKVVKDILSGSLYKDNKTLSNRIWNISGKFNNDIQYTINQAMMEKKSAIELAKDLEQFVLDPAKRSWDWKKIYPILKNTSVDYNAMRLARTSINHSYQTATIQSSQMNPFVEGIEWRSANIHGRTCELCMERDGRIYSVKDVPLDHP